MPQGKNLRANDPNSHSGTPDHLNCGTRTAGSKSSLFSACPCEECRGTKLGGFVPSPRKCQPENFRVKAGFLERKTHSRLRLAAKGLRDHARLSPVESSLLLHQTRAFSPAPRTADPRIITPDPIIPASKNLGLTYGLIAISPYVISGRIGAALQGRPR